MVMVALSTIFSTLLIAACVTGIGLMVSHAWPKLASALAGPAPARRASVASTYAPASAAPLRQAA